MCFTSYKTEKEIGYFLVTTSNIFKTSQTKHQIDMIIKDAELKNLNIISENVLS